MKSLVCLPSLISRPAQLLQPDLSEAYSKKNSACGVIPKSVRVFRREIPSHGEHIMLPRKTHRHSEQVHTCYPSSKSQLIRPPLCCTAWTKLLKRQTFSTQGKLLSWSWTSHSSLYAIAKRLQWKLHESRLLRTSRRLAYWEDALNLRRSIAGWQWIYDNHSKCWDYLTWKCLEHAEGQSHMLEVHASLCLCIELYVQRVEIVQ